MKRLIVMRHAKATHQPGFDDQARPLTARGHRDAAAAGAWLRRQGLIPDLVICSPAVRTRETWTTLSTSLTATPTPSDRALGEPASSDSAPSDPAPSGLAPGEPAPGEPVSGDSVQRQPAPGDPASSELLPGEPVLGKPVLGGLVLGEPVPTELTPSEPLPVVPVPGEPAPSRPAAGGSAPGELVPGEPPAPIVWHDSRLYEADVDDMLDIISETPGDISTLLLVGHNPAARDTAARLTATNPDFPTSAIAVIDLPAWSRTAPGAGDLHTTWTPATP